MPPHICPHAVGGSSVVDTGPLSYTACIWDKSLNIKYCKHRSPAALRSTTWMAVTLLQGEVTSITRSPWSMPLTQQDPSGRISLILAGVENSGRILTLCVCVCMCVPVPS